MKIACEVSEILPAHIPATTMKTGREPLENLEPDDIVIIVVGPSGVGKSSFINTATGKTLLEVGRGLSPCTQDFAYVRCTTLEDRRRVVFVDTPAFSDPYTSNANLSTEEKGGKISEWIKEAKHTGILYLHSMTDNRLTEPLLHYEIFKKLCGSGSLPVAASVLFVLTMCEKVNPETCQNRREYLTNHWKEMMGEKARVCSHYGTKQSAWDVVAALGVL